MVCDLIPAVNMYGSGDTLLMETNGSGDVDVDVVVRRARSTELVSLENVLKF